MSEQQLSEVTTEPVRELKNPKEIPSPITPEKKPEPVRSSPGSSVPPSILPDPSKTSVKRYREEYLECETEYDMSYSLPGIIPFTKLGVGCEETCVLNPFHPRTFQIFQIASSLKAEETDLNRLVDFCTNYLAIDAASRKLAITEEAVIKNLSPLLNIISVNNPTLRKKLEESAKGIYATEYQSRKLLEEEVTGDYLKLKLTPPAFALLLVSKGETLLDAKNKTRQGHPHAKAVPHIQEAEGAIVSAFHALIDADSTNGKSLSEALSKLSKQEKLLNTKVESYQKNSVKYPREKYQPVIDTYTDLVRRASHMIGEIQSAQLRISKSQTTEPATHARSISRILLDKFTTSKTLGTGHLEIQSAETSKSALVSKSKSVRMKFKQPLSAPIAINNIPSPTEQLAPSGSGSPSPRKSVE